CQSRVIEAKQLSGANIQPLPIEVCVGDQYFAYEFHMSKWELFEPGHPHPDHSFFHKWACLIDPKDILGGPKGYVKCDINVIGKGEQAKASAGDANLRHQKKSKPSDDDDIEANLLLPMGVSVKRQMVELAVKIYRAEDLPRMNTDIMATLSTRIYGGLKTTD
uniref:FerI domain-containing protein n=1 Tax=Macrostomum lignano TaxID=282301 RepID=A0A1I8F5X1_9PLAT